MRMSRLFRCTLAQAEYVRDTLESNGVNTIGIWLNPVVNGTIATQLIPVESVAGLEDAREYLSYVVMVELDGDAAKMNAAAAFRTLFPANPWGLGMLLDELAYQKRFGIAEVERLRAASLAANVHKEG